MNDIASIDENDFPELFCNADTVSRRTQRAFILSTAAQLWLLIFSAVFFLFSSNSQIFAVITVLLLLSNTGLSIFTHTKDYQSAWYKSRALAESVKTMSWRFMMQADPYSSDSEPETRASLRNDFRSLLEQNRVLASELGASGEPSATPAITPKMEAIRTQPFEKRKEIYLKLRIDDQRLWYAKKAKFNKRAEQGWFWTMVALQTIAIVLAVVKVAQPGWEMLPIDVFIVASGAVLSWVQVKKFRELSAAYGLTAHEISLLRGDIEAVDDNTDLSDFVTDTENAFSREHTQWLARKDH